MYETKKRMLINKHSFKDIYDLYWEKLYLKACRHINSTDAAEDIVQNIFIELWENRESIVIQKSMGNYLHGALKKKILYFYRTQYRRQEHMQRICFNAPMKDESPETRLIFSELLEKVENMITLLPRKSKEVFELKQKNNLSNKEIANTLSISEKTVEYHIRYARKFLKNYCGDLVLSIISILLSLL